MNIRHILVVLALSLLAIFTLANWSAVMAPTPLSLIFTTIEAPLGLILLSFTGILTLLFLVFVVYMQGSLMLESRRLVRSLESQRELADKAEASRFTELRSYLEAELQALKTSLADNHQAELAEQRAAESRLQTCVEQTGTTLTAYLGELEDRLENNPDEASRTA